MKNNLFNKINGEVVRIFSEDDLLNLKGNVSFDKDIVTLEYMGDLYLYKKVLFDKKVFYKYYRSICWD